MKTTTEFNRIALNNKPRGRKTYMSYSLTGIISS